jgi:hypothetical protein
MWLHLRKESNEFVVILQINLIEVKLKNYYKINSILVHDCTKIVSPMMNNKLIDRRRSKIYCSIITFGDSLKLSFFREPDMKTQAVSGIHPFDLVIFGGSGDLTMRKLLPSLYYHHCDGLLASGGRVPIARPDRLRA